jgi:hypothetical protein
MQMSGIGEVMADRLFPSASHPGRRISAEFRAQAVNA